MIVLVPMIMVAGICISLSNQVETAEYQIENLQKAKNVLLELNNFETRVARTILNLTNPANQDARTINREIATARSYFSQSEQWNNLGEIDPDLAEIVEDFQSARTTILNFIDKVDKVVKNPNISISRRAKKIPSNMVAVIALNNQELAQRVVRVESKINALEAREINRFRGEVVFNVAVSLFCAILWTATFGIFAVRDMLQRLKVISQKAMLVSSGKPLPPAQPGRDEIARLEQTIHTTSNLIAELRRKETALLNSAADVVLTLDDRFKITGVGHAVLKLWDYSQDELLGKSIITLLSRETIDSTIAELNLIEKVLSESEFENEIRTKCGALKTFAWSVRWLSEEKKFYCVAHDVTERRAVEKLKQQFTSMISHDLRAPVTVIGISLQLLISGNRGELSEAVKQTLQKSEATTDRLIALVNELLDLDKLEAGKSNLNKEFISIFEICTAAKQDLEAMADQHKVKLMGPQGDAALYADQGRISQAVKNLLSNAIKFSPENSSVLLSIVRDGRNVELRIKDEGPGIAPDELDLIFNKFQQSRVSKNTKAKGTGLGLTIVKALVEAHGGTVGVESSQGNGSTFWIRLPEDKGDDWLE